MTISFYEYKKFVAQECFIPEPDSYYNLMRIGLELAEEYLEYMASDSTEEAISELSDMYFWATMLHSKLYGFSNEPELPECSLTDELIGGILGSIKRYYRDRNVNKLEALKSLVLDLFAGILQESVISLEQLRQLNYEKLSARLAKGTIQGEGAR